MPLIDSPYKPPVYLPGGDLQSIIPAIARVVQGVQYRRERIKTPDHDFIDIDWVDTTSTKVALVIHGLEASAESAYIRGMSKALHVAGYKVAAMNLRGCSGEINHQVRSYHSGSTDDVETVIHHILRNTACENLVLIGFSLGGNLVLKYLGERITIPSIITAAVAISVPCDLHSCAIHLDSRIPFLYRDRFLRTLKQKAASRIHNLPFELNHQQLKKISTFLEFDDYYTSQLYGFRDAVDYYVQCSSKQFIHRITIPTLVLTAKNDPFFTSSCFPFDECSLSSKVYLETPEAGGHVGFCVDLFSGIYYSEQRAVAFLALEARQSHIA